MNEMDLVKGAPSLIQGRYGNRGNYEVVVPLRYGGLGHIWHFNSGPDMNNPWSGITQFAFDTLFDSAVLIQNNFNMNLEIVAVSGNRLIRYTRTESDRKWRRGISIAEGVCGTPGFVQGRYDRRGNYEVVVPLVNGGLGVIYHNNDGAEDAPWSPMTVFAQGRNFSAVCLIQSNFGKDLEAVALSGTTLYRYYYSEQEAKWLGGTIIAEGVSGSPGLVQGPFGKKGNFEVVVPLVNGGLGHLWHYNDGPADRSNPWSGIKSFATDKVFTHVSLISPTLSDLCMVAVSGNALFHYVRQNGQWLEKAQIAGNFPHRSGIPFVDLTLYSDLPTQPPGDWKCGVFAATRLLQAYRHEVTLDEMANRIGPLTLHLPPPIGDIVIGSGTQKIGNLTQNIVKEMRKTDSRTQMETYATFEFVLELLAQGKPVSTLVLVGHRRSEELDMEIPLLHWFVLAGFDDHKRLLKVYNTNSTTYSYISYGEFLDQWNWKGWQPFKNGHNLDKGNAIAYTVNAVLDNAMARNAIFWIDAVSPLIQQVAWNIDGMRAGASRKQRSVTFTVNGEGVTNCTFKRAYVEGEAEARKRLGTDNFNIDIVHLERTFKSFFNDRGIDGRDCGYTGEITAYSLDPNPRFLSELHQYSLEPTRWRLERESGASSTYNNTGKSESVVQILARNMSIMVKLEVLPNDKCGCNSSIAPSSGDTRIDHKIRASL